MPGMFTRCEVTRPRRSPCKTETRPKRSKNVSRPHCRSLKTLTGDVCHLTSCFFWVRSIIFFLIYPQAWCIAWMFTRPKVTKPETETLYLQDRDIECSRPRRDRDVQFFQTLETEMRTRCSKKRLETEMFKTEITSLHYSKCWFFDCGLTALRSVPL